MNSSISLSGPAGHGGGSKPGTRNGDLRVAAYIGGGGSVYTTAFGPQNVLD